MREVELIPVAAVADDLRRIGTPPVAAAEVAQLALPGMTLIVDPSDPLPAAHALVYDSDLAGSLIEVLFGADVAQAASEAITGSVPCVLAPELADLEHLGVLTWLNDHRPLPNDPSLLTLELAVTRTELIDEDGLVDDPPVIHRLTGLARNIREHPEVPLAAELRQLFRAALPHLPLGDPDFPEVDHERELLAAGESWGGAALTPKDLAWLADQLAPQAADHLGSSSRLSGSCPIDWRRVPAALLPGSETAVRYEIRDRDVVVRVQASPTAQPHPAVPAAFIPFPALTASLRSSAWPLPLAEGPLEFDARSGGWVAGFTIPAAAMDLVTGAPTLDVDVRSSVLAWKPANQTYRRAAAARRWAARGIAARRVGAAGRNQALDAAGTGALLFAARLWSAADGPVQAERCRSLARAASPSVRLSLAESWLLVGR